MSSSPNIAITCRSTGRAPFTGVPASPLERSTIAYWVGGCAVLLEPLAQAITRHVRAGAALRSACAFEIRTEKPH
jgi:hypothetical protein